LLVLQIPKILRLVAVNREKHILDCISSLAKQDKNAIITKCFTKDDAWIKKTNIDYFSPETFTLEVRQLKPAFRVIEPKISGGKSNGNTADILVEGMLLIQRLESTGDIIEVDKYPVKGNIQMGLVGGMWVCTGDDLKRTTE
jgi:hypothetical protein